MKNELLSRIPFPTFDEHANDCFFSLMSYIGEWAMTSSPMGKEPILSRLYQIEKVYQFFSELNLYHHAAIINAGRSSIASLATAALAIAHLTATLIKERGQKPTWKFFNSLLAAYDAFYNAVLACKDDYDHINIALHNLYNELTSLLETQKEI